MHPAAGHAANEWSLWLCLEPSLDHAGPKPVVGDDLAPAHALDRHRANGFQYQKGPVYPFHT